MDQEYAKPRDADSDLAEITSRLGEPDSTHRTNTSSVVWRFILGVLIVLAAGGIHYAFWSGIVPWPKARAWKLWIVIIAMMFVGPGVGVYLIGFAVRGLKLWVLVYRTGLFIWHRGQVVAFPWDEIRAVQLLGMPDKAVLNRPVDKSGFPESVWYDLGRSDRRVFGTTITLTRTDGEQVSLPSTLGDFPELGRRVQEETFHRLFPQHWDDFEAGKSLQFGPISCDRDSMTLGTKSLPWTEVDSIERVGDKLEVKRQAGKKKKIWARCDLNAVVNLHILMGIAQAARKDNASLE